MCDGKPWPSGFLLPVILHRQNLNDTDTKSFNVSPRSIEGVGRLDVQDVDKIQFQADSFIERVSLDNASFSETSMLQDLLGARNTNVNPRFR